MHSMKKQLGGGVEVERLETPGYPIWFLFLCMLYKGSLVQRFDHVREQEANQ
jgi:hypothetical protein